MDLPEYAIEAKNLVKTYAATKTTPEMQALKGLDLAIPRGSIFGLLGPNGAGKSTFINILAGLCQKTSGTVSIWGRDIDRTPATPAPPSGSCRRRSPPTRSSRRERRWKWPRACTPCRNPSAGPTSC